MDESHLNYTDFTHNSQIEHPFHTSERKIEIHLIICGPQQWQMLPSL